MTVAELPSLELDEFAAFFAAVHGPDPFPWQRRLAEQLATEGWPRVLDLPTGCGKTAAIDAAVFHLALEAGRASRRAPLRIVYVVDRRTIVDQAYERATRIVRTLRDANDGILTRVRRRLESIGRDSIALRATMLRGAIARSDLWARSPDQPLIAVSTVDQVGSRLLFRGYGVSDGMKPIHAGLLGNDVLYLLDEVHLSEPFRETLHAVAGRYAQWAEIDLPRRFEVVAMSATPGGEDASAFRLGTDDQTHPVLEKRLAAAKPARLIATKGVEFFKEAERAVKEFTRTPGTRVAAVVNRVAAAREMHRRLAAALPTAEVRLITGRMRPVDRDRLERDVIDRITANESRAPLERSLVVVATQCIEAGADFDFDTLVTECASLDALRQRFGRVDRLGLRGVSQGVVIARHEQLADDPVYGTALGSTWEWLREQGGERREVDFGLRGLVVPDDAAERGLLSPKSQSPVLLPTHLDSWVQTAPSGIPDPEIALWLHGPARGVADVQVVWRADLPAELLAAAVSDRMDADRALSIVDATPPASGEAMAVPFVAARRWLEGAAGIDVADIEGVRSEDDEQKTPAVGASVPRPVIVWRGERSEVLPPDGIRPGDTIVVPATYGGIASGTWAPDSVDLVNDIAERAILAQRGRAMLRLHRDVLTGMSEALPPPPTLQPLTAEDVDDEGTARAWLANATTVEVDGDVGELLQILANAAAQRRGIEVMRVTAFDDRDHLVVSARARVLRRSDEVTGEVTTEGDAGSFTGVEVTLADHMRGVGTIAGEFARRVGLPASVAADIELAARWHDAGKADPRFQRLLHGGSEARALAAQEPLAKSRTPMHDRRIRKRAIERSGYPSGTRHEVMSIALMTTVGDPIVQRATDWDLVLHLVGSHHGHCRPFAPWAADPAPVTVAVSVDGLTVAAQSDHGLAGLDSGIGARFWRLVRRYGWWGLAWLETVLRLGDHRRSELEQQASTRRFEGAA